MTEIILTEEELNLIQSLRKQKAQKGAEFTHSNEGSNTPNQKKSEQGKRTYKVDPNQSASTAAMRKFRSLPLDYQNTETKWACVMSVLGTRHLDIARFAVWVLDMAQKLQLVHDFMKICAQYQREPQAVAENLVLEGKAICNIIRLNGLASYNGNIRLFEKRLIPDEYRFNKPAEVLEQAAVATVESKLEEGANA